MLGLAVPPCIALVFSQTHYAITGLGTATSITTAMRATSVQLLSEARLVHIDFHSSALDSSHAKSPSATILHRGVAKD